MLTTIAIVVCFPFACVLLAFTLMYLRGLRGSICDSCSIRLPRNARAIVNRCCFCGTQFHDSAAPAALRGATQCAKCGLLTTKLTQLCDGRTYCKSCLSEYPSDTIAYLGSQAVLRETYAYSVPVVLCRAIAWIFGFFFAAFGVIALLTVWSTGTTQHVGTVMWWFALSIPAFTAFAAGGAFSLYWRRPVVALGQEGLAVRAGTEFVLVELRNCRWAKARRRNATVGPFHFLMPGEAILITLPIGAILAQDRKYPTIVAVGHSLETSQAWRCMLNLHGASRW